ncbi:MAG TPA: NAD(P)-binding domain-containing protein [candidate division Zixibacteria bacterium]|nr:NAD(P)-binding domain-containing protein [candidate division Zixibacteria bacterium]
MALRRIGILSIGEMGYHWARLLRAHGVEVLTYDRDRGEVTRRRGENAGVRSQPSMAALVREADLIVSIVVPSAAKSVAAAVARAAAEAGRRDVLFLDANAISPMTASEIAAIAAGAGVEFVDGCIIGSAAKMGRGTAVYVSGPGAARVRELETFSIPVKVLGDGVNQASAFKIVYAGLTKGLQGLFVELLMGARRFGLLDEIMARYEESFPGLLDKIASSIIGLRIHAGRRAEEMDELKRAFNHQGLEAFMAPAAQKVLESIAALELGETSARGEREGNLLDTLETFYQKGLLQSGPAPR